MIKRNSFAHLKAMCKNLAEFQIQSNFSGSNTLGSMKIVRDRGSSSH